MELPHANAHKTRALVRAVDPPPLRNRFPILRKQTYLNTCSLGAYSTNAAQRVAEFYAEWSTLGAPAWYKIWWDRLELTRATFARLIGARAEEVAILPSVSTALNVLASALDLRARPAVVTTQLDFPTIPYAWMAKPHVRVRRVGRRDGVQVPIADYRAAIDESVAAVATSHVFYATGAIQDVAEITRLAHARGALSLIDSYHGAGQLPIDVADLGVDAMVSGGLKWLLGGPGCALLYVRRDVVRRLQPTVTGWFANQDQFRFDPESFAFRPSAARFELGTPSLPSTFATLGGMELVARVGTRRIRARQNRLVTDLYEKLIDAGYAVASPERERDRAGILMVRVPDAPAAVERLAREKIIVDHRDGKVRVSPYFYNSIRENDRFLKELRKAAPPFAPSSALGKPLTRDVQAVRHRV